MICTNPDLVVDRGENREYCAGSVAKIYESLGGKVIYFGKPYSEVYKQAVKKNSKNILAIGDNLNTDIRGANIQNYECILITGTSLAAEPSRSSVLYTLTKAKEKLDELDKDLVIIKKL